MTTQANITAVSVSMDIDPIPVSTPATPVPTLGTSTPAMPNPSEPAELPFSNIQYLSAYQRASLQSD